jgi:hypothetical protein
MTDPMVQIVHGDEQDIWALIDARVRLSRLMNQRAENQRADDK